MPDRVLDNPEVREAFAEYDRQETIYNFKVASIVGMILMPLGIPMDYYMYPALAPRFLQLRFECSALIGVFLGLLLTPSGQRYYRFQGILLFMVPASFIAWMIHMSPDGAASPYYAGLNLVLLVLAFLLHWTFRESLAAAALVLVLYIAASFIGRPFVSESVGPFANNIFFLGCTVVIVVTGSYFHSIARYREFALRFELDRNKKQLEESNQKLLELDQIKGRFFANISHELRTPLTLLLAPLETIQRKYARSFDEDSRNLLVTMQSNGMRLLKLINDLLDLVRLESGVMQVKREALDVADFLKGLASATRQVAVDKRVALETHTDPALGIVQADRDKLEKIILNLLFNALKFTPSGGRVELRAEKQGEKFVLSVKDTGMGISAKNLPNIFSRFWQADDTSRRKYQGVGIGLALVKELAEVQGGTAAVDSVEGEGTTFTIRLPYLKGEPQQTPIPKETTPVAANESTTQSSEQPSGGTVSSQEWLSSLYRRAELFPAMTPLQETLKQVEVTRTGNQSRVLIADDEPDMLRFLKSQLSGHYQIIEAVDGQQAVDKAGQFLPDLILLDMMMPEKDGLQACKEIREHTPTQSIPVVLITARADEETKLAALEAGASDFLSKPFSTTELHVRVKNLVDSHEYQLKVARQNQVLESTIDQLKDTETQLVQSEKLASLGRMSAGIIHEINNPLNFATTGLYSLRSKGRYIDPEQKAEYDDTLKDIEEGIKRVKTIVSDLRMFTHPDTESREQVQVDEVVRSALRFLSGEWKDKVQIDRQIAEHQTLLANKNKLIHVLVNLLQNSLDALGSKQFANGETPTISIMGRVQNGSSILTVRDNGPGIQNEHLNKIFDPFFTTKDVGEGMGLGLSICYRIVQEYDGHISVNTEAGKFSEFTLEFPAKD
jgi:signal transduction histidine kinase